MRGLTTIFANSDERPYEDGNPLEVSLAAITFTDHALEDLITFLNRVKNERTAELD